MHNTVKNLTDLTDTIIVPKNVFAVTSEDLFGSLVERNGVKLEVTPYTNINTFRQRIQSEKPPAGCCILVDCQIADDIALFQDLNRTPAWLHTPVIAFDSKGATLTHSYKKYLLERHGITQFLEFPLLPEKVNAVFDRVSVQLLDPHDYQELDQGFADDSQEQLAHTLSLLTSFNAETTSELFMVLHTLKGGSRSMHLPALAHLIHEAESALQAIRNHQRYQWEGALQFFQELIQFSIHYLSIFKIGDSLPQIPDVLLKKALTIQLVLETGLEAMPVTQALNASAASTASSLAKNEPNMNSTRIPHRKMDELQNQFKKIQQTRVKLNSFANNLKSEFADETFPDDLTRLVSQLNEQASCIFDFFISLRVVPTTVLKPIVQRIVHQTGEIIGKDVQLEFSTDENLEMDRDIIGVLEESLAHIIRNSIDHGIEDINTRKSLGKPPQGTIRIKITQVPQRQCVIQVQDDGAGISVDLLKEKFSKSGLISKEDLSLMSDEKAMDLVFVDGLTTREEANELSGRGVGLSAVKKRISELDGSIRAQSQPKQGTTFTIQLPRFFQL